MELDNILQQVNSLPSVSSRAMFGGHGLYTEGRIFALVEDDVIFLKADQQAILKYEEVGREPFTYLGANGLMTMKYYRFPTVEIMQSMLPEAGRVAKSTPLPKTKRPRKPKA